MEMTARANSPSRNAHVVRHPPYIMNKIFLDVGSETVRSLELSTGGILMCLLV